MVVSEGGMTTEKWLDSYHHASFKAGKRGPQATESSTLQELEKERKQIFSQSLQNGTQLCQYPDFDLCWTSDLQKYKVINL